MEFIGGMIFSMKAADAAECWYEPMLPAESSQEINLL